MPAAPTLVQNKADVLIDNRKDSSIEVLTILILLYYNKNIHF
jgi:hypothetical protein